MNVNELRIGNYITTSYRGFKIFLITEINKGTVSFDSLVDNFSSYTIYPYVKPIPLTEEILLKCGFKKREYSTADKWFIGENPITYDWMFELTWINGDSSPFFKNGFHKINYLHQLQNLYFILTGEELEINL